MGSINYSFSVRDSSVTSGENRKTGLAPTWAFFKAAASGTNITPQPTIAEVAGGVYRFAYDPAANGEAVGQVDAGNSLANYSDRYIDIACPVDTADVRALLPAVVCSGAISAATTGSVTLSSSIFTASIPANTFQGMRLAISTDDAHVPGVGSKVDGSLCSNGSVTLTFTGPDAWPAAPAVGSTGYLVGSRT